MRRNGKEFYPPEKEGIIGKKNLVGSGQGPAFIARLDSGSTGRDYRNPACRWSIEREFDRYTFDS